MDRGSNSSTERPNQARSLVVTEHPAIHPALRATIQAGRHHGVELDPNEYRAPPGQNGPSAAALSQWAQNAGVWSRAVRVRWRDLFHFQDSGPVVLLLKDGSAALMTGARSADRIVYLTNPEASPGAPPVAVDELRLSENWGGEAVLLRPVRSASVAESQFSFRWLARVVLHEHAALRDIGLASLAISVLTIFPPLLVMATVNKVLQFHSVSTLVLLSTVMAIIFAFETLLGYARRLIVSVVGARLDTRLNLHVFNRLLRLPLDYFEHHPAGETMYRLSQIQRIREFLTGKLLTTFLDLITLVILLPILFYLQPILASIVLVCAILIGLIILAYLMPLRTLYLRVVAAETWKAAALSETVVGIKTVKSLGLEPQRRAIWDERIADAGKWRLAFGQLANWPQTLVTPLERIMVLGTIMVGAYLAITSSDGYMVGSLFAFMMLSARVAAPLTGLAKLVGGPRGGRSGHW